MLQPNVVLLFEILECNPMLIAQNSKLLNQERLYPIAWAYLRPLGTATIHMSRARLQLYRYKMKHDQMGLVDLKTPNVLLEFNWTKKDKYPSFLEVELSFCNRSIVEIERKHFARAPWEKEISPIKYMDEEMGVIRPEEMVQPTTHDHDMRLKSWEKFLDMPSMLPNIRQWKFDTDRQGCHRIEFSNQGKYLAMACTMQSGKTVIKIADVEHGQIKIILRGHHDLIHDMSWSSDDNYLVSASADGSAKVYDLTNKETDYADKLNYTENDAMFFLCTLPHCSYVYAAKIFPDTNLNQGNIIVATACFDGKVRLWSVLTNEENVGANVKPEFELSLTEKPQRILAQK